MQQLLKDEVINNMRIPDTLKNMGIKGRLTVLMLASGICLLIAIAAVMLPFYRWNLTSMLGTQQTTLLTAIQTEIDAKLSLAQTQLAAVAGVMPPEAMQNSAAALRFLKNRVGIAQIFDNGLAVLNADGVLIAETPQQPNRTIFDFSQHPFFKQAIVAQNTAISAPFRSTKPPHHPVVQFSAPVRDRSGRVIGILSGGLRLDGTSVIGSITRHRIGTSGYLYLYAKDRTMLVHPDPKRIMQQDVPPGVNRLFDKALTGWEGTGRTVNSRGLPMVASFRQIQNAPWILASNIPEQEAFKPANRAAVMLVTIVSFIGLLAMALSWLALRSITNPLVQFSDHLERLESKQGDERQFVLDEKPPRELQLLTANFNRMQYGLDQQQTELSRQMEDLHEQARMLEQEVAVRQHTEQELHVALVRNQAARQLLQTISDNVPDLIWAKDLQHRYLFSNQINNSTLLFPQSPDEPLGKQHDFFAARIIAENPDNPDWYRFSDLCAQSDEETLTSRQPMQFQEYGMVRGELVCLDVYKAPLYDLQGHLIGTVGSARIVTKEKQLEQENARLTRLYRIQSEISQKIVHRPEPLELLQFACTTLIADQGFTMAWVGLPDGMGGYFPALSAGLPLERLQSLGSFPPPAENRLIIPDVASLCATEPDNQPYCSLVALMEEHPFTALAVYLIRPAQGISVLLTVYTPDPHMLTHTAEQRLLDELVEDLAYALDVTEQDRIGLQHRQQLELAATVFDNSYEGIDVTDCLGRIISVNRAFCEITGYQPEEVLGQTHKLMQSGRHDRSFYQALWHTLLETGRWQGEIWNRRKDGQIYPELLSISAVKDDQGAVSCYISVFSDISGIKQTQQQIVFLEWHDPLTDLPNRRMICNHLTQAIDLARRKETSIALLCLDLDHFKDINDSFGHLTGDALLRLTAKRLRERMRSSDMVARLGGDEFIVLLEELEQTEHVPLIAEDIITLLQQPFRLDSGIELQSGVSIGIALFPDHGQSAMELLQQADSALYQAKQQGRGRFAYYRDDMTEKALERINLGNYLRRAVEKEELLVYYQPQVEGSTGRIIGAEALMRWQNPALGLVSPVRFIPLAEEIGCIIPMGEWILRHTCLQGRQWLDQGLPPLTLAVNLSPAQIHQPGLVETVHHILDTTGYPAELLELELTESALMKHEEETIDLLNQLKGLGIKLALDDFGTGYSSLAYLKHFPLDLLKVDKSFVDDLPQGTKDLKIVTTIVQMGRSLGFKLLAEGVEREEQRNCLHNLGCDFYQGYLFGKPVPAESFAELLLRQKCDSDRA
jgi:diguanylate cyclase (GGDEF)-like protein/PAS domain S-box-containing protein